MFINKKMKDLGHKNAIRVKLGFEDVLVEGFSVELITRPTFHWIS